MLINEVEKDRGRVGRGGGVERLIELLVKLINFSSILPIVTYQNKNKNCSTYHDG